VGNTINTSEFDVRAVVRVGRWVLLGALKWVTSVNLMHLQMSVCSHVGG